MKTLFEKILFLGLLLFMSSTHANDLPKSGEEIAILDGEGLPKCLYPEGKESAGIVFFWDKTSKLIPRNVLYSKMEELRYIEADHYRRRKIHKCDDFDYIDKKNLLGHMVQPEEGPLKINGMVIDESMKERIRQVQNGHNLYFNPVIHLGEDFLESTFGKFKKKTNRALIDDFGVETATRIYHQYISSKNLPENCADLIGTCDYYLCREMKNSCKADGYYLGFGYQYCSESLTNLLSKVSAKSKRWLVATATCLQRKMEQNGDQGTCKEVKAHAISSHDECYNEVNFCSMKIQDILQIMKMIYPELTDVRILREGLQVLLNCHKDKEKK